MLTQLPEKTYRRAAHIFLGLLAAIVLLTFRHYGVSWDEEIQSQYGQAIYDYYASLFVDRRYAEIFNLYLYGGMFDGLAALFNVYTPVTVYETRHLLNAFVGLLGLWGTWRLGRLLGGGFVGLAAMVLLALTPMYYGHMFNNPKDIPFAAGVVWSLYFMAKSYLAWPNIRPSLILKLGIVYGLTLGVRVNGIMFFGFWSVVLAVLALVQARTLKVKTVLHLLRVGFSVLVVSYAVMLFCWPWAQEAPFENPLRAVLEFSNFPQIVEVLFDHETYMSTELPWYYVPMYFAVQLPLAQLFAIGGGLLFLPFLPLPKAGQKAALALMLLGVFFPILYAMASRPALYDAVRHFLFVLPPLCVIAGFALKAFFHRLYADTEKMEAGKKAALRGVTAVTLLVLLFLPLDKMARLHPYEYIYMNELEGGVKGAFGQYELDYWATSFKEAAEKLQKFVAAEGGVPAGKIYKVAICGPWATAMIQLPPDYDIVIANEPADFFMATTRWMCHRMRGVKEKEIVRVQRMGVPLSVVKDLRGTEEGLLGMPNYREEQAEKAREEKDGGQE